MSHPRTIQSEIPRALEGPYRDALETLRRVRAIERLKERDPSLWKEDAEHAAVIRNRLGWLDAPAWLESRRAELEAFSEEARREGFTRAIILGMGGSSLAAEVFQSVCRPGPGAPTLDVLDSTDPAAVLSLERASRLDRTLFLVASKSGSTIETMSQYRYYRARLADAGVENPGRHFVAVTDEGSPLDRLAADEGFRRVFRNPADVGGRYSALTYFGMVPAAILGLDVGGLAGRARLARTESLGPEPDSNPALRLAALLAAGARSGRDKLTIAATGPLRPVGYWIEQLVAESTGKEGTGIVPVEGEPWGPVHHYGDDRVLLSIALMGEPDPELAHLESEWARTGAPSARIELPDRDAVAGEFFRWEVATALAGALLGIDPFDEPNVQESKDLTAAILAAMERTGSLPEEEPRARDGSVEIRAADALWSAIQSGAPSMPSLERVLQRFLAMASPGEYLAILAFVERTAAAEASFAFLRRAIRNAIHVPVLQGYGPRYLHSIGQLYKGGPPRGLFLVITAENRADVSIPGRPYTFGQLEAAQAEGDYQAIRRRGRPTLRLHIRGAAESGLGAIAQAAERAVSTLQSA